MTFTVGMRVLFKPSNQYNNVGEVTEVRASIVAVQWPNDRWARWYLYCELLPANPTPSMEGVKI